MLPPCITILRGCKGGSNLGYMATGGSYFCVPATKPETLKRRCEIVWREKQGEGRRERERKGKMKGEERGRGRGDEEREERERKRT